MPTPETPPIPNEIPNEQIVRSAARTLMGVPGENVDNRCKLTFVDRIVPVKWPHRLLLGIMDRPNTDYALTLGVLGVGTLEDALKEWAAPERLDGDNCYVDEWFGEIPADKSVKLAELPDTLVVELRRWRLDSEQPDGLDVVTDAVKVPMTLDFAQLGDVLERPSQAKYNLLAIVVGTRRWQTPQDKHIFWKAFVRLPGGEMWHCVRDNFIAQCMQYTDQDTVPTEYVRTFLDCKSNYFVMKAWFQNEDADVQVTTPSAAAWQESWRDEFEACVHADNGGGPIDSGVAVGIPVAVAIE